MTQESIDRVSQILQARCGVPTTATLSNGQTIKVHNIAWGRDMGAVYDHITTNISPEPECPHSIDFFITDDIVLLVAPESGQVLYRRDTYAA